MVTHDDGGDDDRDRDESASYRHDGAFHLQNSLNSQNVLTQAQVHKQALLPQVQEQALLPQVQQQALLPQVQQQVLLLLLHALQLVLLPLVLQQLLLRVLQLLQHGLVLAQQQRWFQPQELMTPDNC